MAKAVKSIKMALIISIILLFAVVVIKKQYVAFLPLMSLYLVGFVTLLFINYVGGHLFKLKLSIAYPFSFALSLIALVGATSWFSGNTFTETLRVTFLNRKDFVSMVDPYVLGNLITYLVLLGKKMVF